MSWHYKTLYAYRMAKKDYWKRLAQANAEYRHAVKSAAGRTDSYRLRDTYIAWRNWSNKRVMMRLRLGLRASTED